MGSDLESLVQTCSWETYFRTRISFIWKDPDILELCREEFHQEQAWKKYLAMVDNRKLDQTIQALVDKNAWNFEVRDAMELFPHENDAESYRRAVEWMKGLAAGVGIKMRRLRPKPSTRFEIRVLMDRLARLEEETLGLTMQLQDVV